MTATLQHRVLIAGAGSIGRRHARNLRTFGIEHLAFADPSEEQRNVAATELSCDVYDEPGTALQEERPDVVFICSPTKFHVSQALQVVGAGAHVFIEKPLSHTMEGVAELMECVEEKGMTAMVGCNMRFHYGPATIKKLLTEGKIGAVVSAEVYTGSFLPDWRPAQDYRKSYSADPVQGGAILDCIHEIDLALWYLGAATLETASVEPATSIGLTVDGTADLTLQHKNGAVSHVHVSFTEPESRRFCVITGKKGVLKWDISNNCVLLLSPKGEQIASYPEPAGYEFNQAYQEELSHFFRAISRGTEPYGSLAEAKNALHIALQSRQSL